MATFDQLPADQRAIIELLLKRRRTYDALSDMLDMPATRVRELARDALTELAPNTADRVDPDWQAQVADYVLGQQSGPEATATKGHLRRSEAARSWARSLLDSLEQFYENGSVPAIPEGERGRPRRSAAAEPAAGAREPSARPGLAPVGDPVIRRRLLAGAGGLLLVLLIVLVWPVGLLTGDDDSTSADQSSAAGAGTGQQTANGQQAANGQPAGIAIVVQRGDKKQLLVQAANLAPSGQSEGYYVWLYNSPDDAKSLGGQVTDQQGNYQALGSFPADYQKYKYIDVTRQQIGQNANVQHSGDSVLRGPMPKLKQSTSKKAAAIGQTVLRPPS
jgi:hypothetical protein